nr:TonB family protein [Erwinia phyllosphaerae]
MVKNEQVFYPRNAWHLRASGQVSLIYDINQNGEVTNIRIIDSKPYMMFDEIVKDSIRKWRFKSGLPKKDIPLTVKFER